MIIYIMESKLAAEKNNSQRATYFVLWFELPQLDHLMEEKKHNKYIFFL